MNKNKRIILVGPSAAGKTFISEQLQKTGFELEVSYTSRSIREGEIEGKDYKFLSKADFRRRIAQDSFYEWVEYDGNFYGTGKREFYDADVFVWETEGIKNLLLEDRKTSTVIYVNTPVSVRTQRMLDRGWNHKEITKRTIADDQKFRLFTDYDFTIQSI